MRSHMPADVLLVSVLPRLSRTGASALVALNANSLELIRVRCFPAREYLSRSGSMPMEHCRGIAQWDNALWVSMFNAVRRYEVADPETLKLRPGDVFSHPRAVDLHGICVDEDRLLVASTGADTIIEWRRASSEPNATPLSGTNSRDHDSRRDFLPSQAAMTGATCSQADCTSTTSAPVIESRSWSAPCARSSSSVATGCECSMQIQRLSFMTDEHSTTAGLSLPTLRADVS